MIKLWIPNIGEDIFWDDLVSTGNKVKAKTKIQESTNLNQRYPKGKQPLKMRYNSWDNQPEKAQKSGTTLLGQNKAYQAD